MKLGRGLKLRSRCAVLDSNVAMATLEGKNGGTEQSCWESMPRELLREVFMKLEASESSWPSMRNVVVCAGVCRSWREAVKAVVTTPEMSGKLTFPISLKQPGRRDSLIQCFIRRNRVTQTYHLYLNSTPVLADDGKFLLAARRFRRPTCSDFIISLHADDFSKGGSTYIGKLRSNFVATKFIVNDAVPPHPGLKMLKGQPSLRLFGSKHVSSRILAGNYPVAHVSYELNMLGNRGPRKMHCVMDAIPASAAEPGGVVPTQTEFPLRRIDSFPPLLFFRSKANRVPPFNQCHRPLVMRNKSPRWHEQLQCWCLNFHGRVTVASVKNFQLVAAPPCDGRSDPENEKVILQFGKVGKDVFTMDYGYPLSAFQAFAICLSSFDTKIACDS